MTAIEEREDQQTQDQTGSLADSARRHLAYERLVRQVAASEAAARLVLDALARRGQAADPSGRSHDAAPRAGH